MSRHISSTSPGAQPYALGFRTANRRAIRGMSDACRRELVTRGETSFCSMIYGYSRVKLAKEYGATRGHFGKPGGHVYGYYPNQRNAFHICHGWHRYAIQFASAIDRWVMAGCPKSEIDE